MQDFDTNIVKEYTKDLSVLYVEDDLIVQKQTHKFLKLLFRSVETANDGQEALNIYEDTKFDIVITDIMMPFVNGLELSKRIKKINPYQNIIVISAYNDSDQLIEFINLHVRQFMLKPVEINNMLMTLYNVSKGIVNDKLIQSYTLQTEQINSIKDDMDILKNKINNLNDSSEFTENKSSIINEMDIIIDKLNK